MVQLLLRDIDFDLVRLLRKRATKNGRTQDEEHRAILEAALRPEHRASGSRLDGIIAALQASGAIPPPPPPPPPPTDEAG